MEWSYSFLGVSTLTLITFIYIYCSRKLSYWTNRRVEQLQTTHWLFGDFKEGLLFQSAPGKHLGQIYKRARQNAPFVGFYIFHKPCLLLRDPKIVKQILVADSDNFSDRHFAGSAQLDSIGMTNLFGLRNPVWRYLRHKITPTLKTPMLKQMLIQMMQTGERMIDFIELQKEKVLDVQKLNYKYAADLIATVTLGTKVDSFNNPNNKFTQNVLQYFYGFKRMIALVSVFFLPELVAVFGSRILVNSQFMKKMFLDAVEERENSGEEKGDFIDSIIKFKNGPQNPLFELSGKNLFDQTGIFLSGFESGSLAATFTLSELARNKSFQDKAREDIRQAVKQYGWTYEGFKAMKFLDQCVAESLRMHPTVPFLDRIAKEDYKIPGTDVTIEKGTPVYISLVGLQEDPKYFENPETFNPERFEQISSFVLDAYMPFGAGPRMCVSMKAGQLHVKVVIALILSQYEIHHDSGNKLDLNRRHTFKAIAGSIKLEFKKLENIIDLKTVGTMVSNNERLER